MMHKRRTIKIISIKIINPSLIVVEISSAEMPFCPFCTFAGRTTMYLLFRHVNIKYLTLSAELRVLLQYRKPRPKSLCRILGSPEVSVIVGKRNKTVSLLLYTPKSVVINRSLIIVFGVCTFAAQCVSIRICCFCNVHV